MSGSGRFVNVMTDPTSIRAPGGAARPFEAWLQTGLQHLYDTTLQEPVPDELLRLLPQGPVADHVAASRRS